MATETKGALTRIGAVPGATWGTPVVVAANRLFEYLSEDISAEVQLIENEQNAGSGTRRAGDRGNKLYAGTVEVPGKFETLDLLWSMFMGTAAAPVQQGADLAYLHSITYAEDMMGKFITLAIAKEIETHEFDSVKVTGFDFESESGSQASKITFHFVCRELAVNTASGTNNNTTMAAATMISARQRIHHNMLALWLNDQTGGALASGDAQPVVAFKLSGSRPYVVDEIPAGASVIVQPVQDGHAMFEGSMTFRVYRSADAALRFADQLAKTQKKATATYTGPTAHGSTAYSLKFWMNALQFQPFAPNVAGAGVFEVEAPFLLHEVASAPTGFTYTRPLAIDLIDTKSTNALL